MSEVENVCDELVDSIKEEKCLDYHAFGVRDFLLLAYDEENEQLCDVHSESNKIKQNEPRFLVSCSWDKTIKIFNLQANKKEEFEFADHKSAYTLHFFQNKYLISTNLNGELNIFTMEVVSEDKKLEMKLFQKIRRIGTGKGYPQIITNPNLPNKECLACCNRPANKGEIIRISQKDDDTKLFTTELFFKNPSDESIERLCFSKKDKSYLYFAGGEIVCGIDFTVKKFNMETKKIEKELLQNENKSVITGLLTIKKGDDEYLLAKSAHPIYELFILKNDVLIKTMDKFKTCCFSTLFTPNHVLVNDNPEHNLLVLNVGEDDNISVSKKKVSKVHEKWVHKLLYFGGKIYSCSDDKTIKIFKVAAPNNEEEEGEEEKQVN